MSRQQNSPVNTLKDILLVLGGLSITNGLIVLIAKGSFTTIANFKDLSLEVFPILFFFLLVVNIVRFYLGNSRLIDDSYLLEFDSTPSDGTFRNKNLVIDYFSVLFAGILLALLSFYLRDSKSFFGVFSCLLLFDILWLISTRQVARDKKISKQRRWWTINNVFFLIPIAISAFSNQSQIGYFYAAFASLVLNTLIDFCLSYQFYFYPTRIRKDGKLKIFLAAPFTQYIDGDKIPEEIKSSLNNIISSLKSEGYEVFSAHVEEKWGEDLDDPFSALKRDFNELRDSEILVAFIGQPPSPGVQMEIGVALAMNKRIIYLIKEGDSYPFLLDGLPKLTDAQPLRYTSYDNALKQIRKQLKSFF